MNDDPGQRLDHELYRSLYESRTILLGEPLEDRNSNRLCNALLLLAAEDPGADIRLLINSPGGSVPGMLAIRDCMRAIPNDVRTVNLGMAYSAGQFLLSSGTKGKRSAMPHSKVLLHQGSAGIGGTAMDIAIQADDLRHTRDTVLACIAEDTGQSVERRGGFAARPVVHRAGSAGLRVHRLHRGFSRRRHAAPAHSDRVGSRGDRELGRARVCPMSSYTIPYVTTRSGNGERTVDIYSRLLADRIVYLGTGVDDGVANAVIAQLLHLENDNPDTPISLYINSAGGSIPATLAIYDAMQFVRPPVETTCVGQAAATAAVLLAGGAAGRRSILPHGRVVIHAPAAEGRGAIPDLILEADEVERVRLMQELILASHTGRPTEQIRRDTERELILTADAAVAYGVVDSVITSRPG